MSLLIEHIKHRKYLLSYEQAHTALYALGIFIGASAWSHDPQVLALRRDALALQKTLRAYNWSTSWPP